MDSLTALERPHLIVAPLAVGARPQQQWLGALRPVFPNPSGATARIAFSLRSEARATLRVHDVAGRVVARLVDGMLPAGDYVRVFQAPPGAHGVYFAELVVGDQRISERLVVAR
jgi:hypothetical protein